MTGASPGTSLLTHNNWINAAIVTSVISLGHWLNLTLIAEGVETLDQLEFLRLANCDLIQGYLLSQPLNAAAATHFLWETANNLDSKFRKTNLEFQAEKSSRCCGEPIRPDSEAWRQP